jgi:hypothetical protein
MHSKCEGPEAERSLVFSMKPEWLKWVKLKQEESSLKGGSIGHGQALRLKPEWDGSGLCQAFLVMVDVSLLILPRATGWPLGCCLHLVLSAAPEMGS